MHEHLIDEFTELTFTSFNKMQNVHALIPQQGIGLEEIGDDCLVWHISVCVLWTAECGKQGLSKDKKGCV